MKFLFNFFCIAILAVASLVTAFPFGDNSRNVGVRGSDHFHGAYRHSQDGVGHGLPGSRGFHSDRISSPKGTSVGGTRVYGS
ncbi:hypothetical protein Zmor_020268 [Zophobas morio]|uniref:Uncharacterized protein n=1 Tax=Zophobas morio TaxID=2755281 RepID=A0AA38I3M3_9CUCU|nr:hypothetical protein Zmor_020268 [Zophobas morio]